MSSSSRFQVCSETSKQARINDRNDQHRLVQIPSHVYQSFAVHTKIPRKVDVVSPWDVCEDRHDAILTIPCVTNQPYGFLHLAHQATKESLSFNSSSFFSMCQDFGKKSKGKKTSSKDLRSKISANGRGIKDISPRKTTTLKVSPTKPTKFQNMLYQGVKDITYTFPTGLLDYHDHTDLYRNVYTYTLINQFHEARGNNQAFRTTFFDRDLFITKCRNRWSEQGKADPTRSKQPISTYLMKMSDRIAADSLPKTGDGQSEAKQSLSGNSAIIENCAPEDDDARTSSSPSSSPSDTQYPSPSPEAEVVQKPDTAVGELGGNLKHFVNMEEVTSSTGGYPPFHGSGESPLKMSCSTADGYVINTNLPKSRHKSKTSLDASRSNISTTEIRNKKLMSQMSPRHSVSQIRKSIQDAGSLIKPAKKFTRATERK